MTTTSAIVHPILVMNAHSGHVVAKPRNLCD